MIEWGLPVIVAALIWWASTGLILYLDRLPNWSGGPSLGGATVVLGLGLVGLLYTRDDTGALAAYAAFFCGIAIWAWHEVSFLSGFLAGPRRTPCPPEARGWNRFRAAAETVFHHELAIAATAALLTLAVLDAPNKVALWTFLVLWAMRLSAKLNLYFGVPAATEELLPDRLSHLKTYFRRASLNALFPFSVTGGAIGVYLLGAAALGTEETGARIGLVLVAALLALAVVEHWFMVLPVQDARLWRWMLPAGREERRARAAAAAAAARMGPRRARPVWSSEWR